MDTRTEVDAAVQELRTIAGILETTEHVDDLPDLADRTATVADLLRRAAVRR